MFVNVDCVVGPVYECVSECDGVQVCIVCMGRCQCELLCVNCMSDWDQTCTKTSNTDKMYLKRKKNDILQFMNTSYLYTDRQYC